METITKYKIILWVLIILVVAYFAFIFSIPAQINKIKQKNYVVQNSVNLTQTKQENKHNTIYTDYISIIVETTTASPESIEYNQTELIY